MSDTPGQGGTADYSAYGSLSVEVAAQVATIKLLKPSEASKSTPPSDLHWDLQVLLNRIREDHSIRVIVITGADAGEFWVPGVGAAERHDAMSVDPKRTWVRMLGMTRLHMTMAEIEKPIIAKVNGDAIGFGQSIMFSCDLIAADETAVVNDVHLGQGQVVTGGNSGAAGIEMGVVPGNGAGALVPLFMSPVKAKEYLMLAKTLTTKELAAAGCINYAVPAEELDALVDDLVQRLLEKSAYALAWTKRLTSRHVVEQLNRTLDAGLAYQMLSVVQGSQFGNFSSLA